MPIPVNFWSDQNLQRWAVCADWVAHRLGVGFAGGRSGAEVLSAAG